MSGQTRGPFSDHSISALTGASTQLLPADPNRQAILFHNASASNPTAISIGSSAALNAGGSITLGSAGSLILTNNAILTNAWQVIGTSGSGFTCYTLP